MLSEVPEKPQILSLSSRSITQRARVPRIRELRAVGTVNRVIFREERSNNRTNIYREFTE